MLNIKYINYNMYKYNKCINCNTYKCNKCINYSIKIFFNNY